MAIFGLRVLPSLAIQPPASNNTKEGFIDGYPELIWALSWVGGVWLGVSVGLCESWRG